MGWLGATVRVNKASVRMDGRVLCTGMIRLLQRKDGRLLYDDMGCRSSLVWPQ